jgi:hypothetical protein
VIATTTSTGTYTYPAMPFLDTTVAAGDVLSLTDVGAGTTVTMPVTGRPAFSADLCGPTTTFSGARDAGATIDVDAQIRYGSYDARNDIFSGSVSSLSGESFSGTYPKAVGPGWRVRAQESYDPSPEITYFSTFSRVLGACPAEAGPATTPTPPPAAPPAKVADVVKPTAKLVAPTALLRPATAYRALTTDGLTTTVMVSEPGTVLQTLYLDDGAALPTATAAAKKKKGKAKAKKPTILGTGATAVAKAGPVKVTVKLSKKGRARLRTSRTMKLALVTTVRDLAGNTRVLPAKRFTVKRAKGKR